MRKQPKYRLSQIKENNPLIVVQSLTHREEALISAKFWAYIGLFLALLALASILFALPGWAFYWPMAAFAFLISGSALLGLNAGSYGAYFDDMGQLLRTSEYQKMLDLYCPNKPLIEAANHAKPNQGATSSLGAEELERYDAIYHELHDWMVLMYVSAGLAIDEHEEVATMLARSKMERQRRLESLALEQGVTPTEIEQAEAELQQLIQRSDR